MYKKLIIFILTLFCFKAYPQGDTIFDKYRQNKEIPSCFIPEFCIALSYYPELKNTKIIVRQKDIKCTMVSRMTPASYFRRKSKRTYLLIIDTLENNKHGLFNDLFTNARVGIIGHELGHVTDYSQRNFFGMIRFGWQYLFSKRKIEQHTDEIAIAHGMGWQLIDYTRIAFDPKKVSDELYQRKLKYYYTPQQLEELINRLPQK